MPSKGYLRLLIAGAVVATAFGSVASANTVYNTSLAAPGFYAGSGNPSTGFTVNTTNGVEFGLGVHYRYGANVLPTTTNIYNVLSGYFNNPAKSCYNVCSLWNIDFSINLQANTPNAGLVLSNITPKLTVENLSTGGTSSIDPLTAFPDSAGWNGGPTSNYAILNTITDWGFQNSENLAFSAFNSGGSTLNFDPMEHTSYLVTLSALDGGGNLLGSVSEQINASPIPASLPLFATALGMMGFFVLRKKRTNGVTSAMA